jgi:hypothetical protein
MMKNLSACFLILACMFACNPISESTSRAGDDSTTVYPTISYLKIKLGPGGQLPSNPYIKEYKAGNKQIIFCGTNHLEDNSDTGNAMFKIIEKKFFECMPTVVVNEGGDISKKQYKSRYDAIIRDGEIGLSKVLADQLLIPVINGDMPDSLEFRALLKRFSMTDFIAYLSTERCMFAFYKSNYERLLKRPFSLETLEPTNPFDSVSYFQTIGRASKEIRDQNLLSRIDQLLKVHDKVFIVFGGWHLLTCEPGLQQIINQYQ